MHRPDTGPRHPLAPITSENIDEDSGVSAELVVDRDGPFMDVPADQDSSLIATMEVSSSSGRPSPEHSRQPPLLHRTSSPACSVSSSASELQTLESQDIPNETREPRSSYMRHWQEVNNPYFDASSRGSDSRASDAGIVTACASESSAGECSSDWSVSREAYAVLGEPSEAIAGDLPSGSAQSSRPASSPQAVASVPKQRGASQPEAPSVAASRPETPASEAACSKSAAAGASTPTTPTAETSRPKTRETETSRPKTQAASSRPATPGTASNKSPVAVVAAEELGPGQQGVGPDTDDEINAMLAGQERDSRSDATGPGAPTLIPVNELVARLATHGNIPASSTTVYVGMMYVRSGHLPAPHTEACTTGNDVATEAAVDNREVVGEIIRVALQAPGTVLVENPDGSVCMAAGESEGQKDGKESENQLLQSCNARDAVDARVQVAIAQANVGVVEAINAADQDLLERLRRSDERMRQLGLMS